MSYQNAGSVLPQDLIEQIQQFIDGECLYIPKKEEKKISWGERSGIRKELAERDSQIAREYRMGTPARELSDRYFLSLKSIYRIVKE